MRPREGQLADDTGGKFALRARPVAIWSLTFSFACLATLAVVVGTGDEDPLASIALALAIFAFALQIVFFVVQLRVASDQDRRSADLYRETSAVLTKIDARSSATVEVIREQFGFVLRHALGAPSDDQVLDVDGDDNGGAGADAETENPDAVIAGGQPLMTQEQVEAAVNRAVRSSIGPDLLTRWQEISRPRPEPNPREEALRRAALFEEEVARLLSVAAANRPGARVVRGPVTKQPDARGRVDFLFCDGAAKGVIELKLWRRFVPPPIVQRVAERVVGVQQALGAQASILVVPPQETRQAIERLRTVAPLPVVTIDEFAALLSSGWPRETKGDQREI